MKIEILIAATLVIAASGSAQAKAKPQTPPPPVAGSCKLDKGIWLGQCQIVPPIKIPKTPKMEKSK